jgi:exoribonuclease R
MIAGILHLNSKTKYGLTSRNVPMYLFQPLNRQQSMYVVGCSQKDTHTNLLVLITPSDIPQIPAPRIPRGNLVQIIGPCGDWKAEREAVHWTYQPHRQPKLHYLEEPSFENRIDLRGYRTFNIDPPGCKDVDDCITLYNDSCIITIADVGAWIVQNPSLLSFMNNGQTLYDNGKAVRPMFPVEVSEDKFSLLPNQDRLGVSVLLKLNSPPEWRRSIVRVTESYTYDEAPPEVKYWAELAAGHFLPDDSHTWIEALMVYYNTYMATQIPEGIIRCHEEPDRERLERYTAICPEAARLAETAAVYRPMREAKPHWGLKAELYTHMTSPIRRWIDAYNQMTTLGEILPLHVDTFNFINKQSKKHDRDLFFLDQLQNPKPVHGTVLEPKKIWVSEWKRLLTIPTEFEIGTHVKIEYYLDMNQPTWKKRMVINVSKENQE